MQEIQKVLDDHDIAGVIVLHKERFAEYFVKINPSYSCAKFEGDRLRIRAKAEDYGGDTNLRNKALTDTSSMLYSLSECTGKLAIPLIQASETLDKAVQAIHFNGGDTSHKAQNN